MAHWVDSTGTSATTYYAVDTGRISNDPIRESMKLEYRSEPLGKIVSARVISGRVSMFAHRGSPIFKDIEALHRSGVSPYYDDPVIPGYDSPAKLFAYEFSVIIDALEYMQGKMAKANLIKEALATLKPGSTNPFVLILTKTRKMIERSAKNNKYEKVKDGFLITDGPFREMVIQGLDVEDLLDIAHFARAVYAAEDTTIKTDLTCVRIYLNKQV